MTRFRLFFAALVIAVGLGGAVVAAPEPAHAWNYTVTCWSTSGSPSVSGTGTSTSESQASVNCIRQLASKRWGSSLCANAQSTWYGAPYWYGVVYLKPNTNYCNYSRGSSMNTQGYYSSGRP